MTAAAPRYEQQRHNTAPVGRRIPVRLWRRQRRPTSFTWRMCTDDQATPERTVSTLGVQTFRWRGGSPGAHLPPGLPAGRGPGSENLASRFRGRCSVGHAGIHRRPGVCTTRPRRSPRPTTIPGKMNTPRPAWDAPGQCVRAGSGSRRYAVGLLVEDRAGPDQSVPDPGFDRRQRDAQYGRHLRVGQVGEERHPPAPAAESR